MIEKQTESIFINGEWQKIDPTKVETIYNPATLEPVTDVSYGGSKETKEAIEAADTAFLEWSELTGRERSKFLYRASELMLDDAERLGKILTMEQGKPLKEAVGEVKGAAHFLLWYAEEASRGYGEWIPSSVKSKRMLVLPKPVGVVGAITPWNFPSSMITRKLAPALAAGCTAVLKPSPETPLSAIEIFKIFEAAGFPKGVVNLVTGDAEAIGKELLTHEKVRMITFTGSTNVGKYLMREASNHVKKVSLELGGHAPIIVFEDADLDKAVSMSLASKFRNNGQTCICANRLYVHESIADEFTNRLKEEVQNMRVGSGLDDNIELGPLINEQAVVKVKNHLKDALNKGAKLEYSGDKSVASLNLEGYFHPPTVISNVTDDMIVMNQETFGPLFPIQPFNDEDKVIAKANDTDYGLAAYIFTENTSRSLRISERLNYGIVGVNDVFPGAPEAPFGGIKQSGNGKEGGHHGMAEFLEQKFISIGID